MLKGVEDAHLQQTASSTSMLDSGLASCSVKHGGPATPSTVKDISISGADYPAHDLRCTPDFFGGSPQTGGT